MSDFEQINKELAEKVMGWKWVPAWTVFGYFSEMPYLVKWREEAKKEHESGQHERWCWADGNKEMFTDWDPEDPTAMWSPTTDLNQIFKYLFTKIAEHPTGVEVTTMLAGRTFYIVISTNQGKRIASKLITDPDKISETICKVILEAWEKINE